MTGKRMRLIRLRFLEAWRIRFRVRKTRVRLHLERACAIHLVQKVPFLRLDKSASVHRLSLMVNKLDDRPYHCMTNKAGSMAHECKMM